jgi:hypothetical protein
MCASSLFFWSIVELGAAPAYASAQRCSPISAAFKPPAGCIEIFVVEVWFPWITLRAKRVAASAGTAHPVSADLRITPPHPISSSGGKVQNALARS